MKRLASYVVALAQVTAVFTALQFEQRTGLSSLWERPENRKLIEQRMTVNHTGLRDGQPYFFENAFKSNVGEIQKYSDAYRCQSGKDTSKCKPVVEQ